MQPSSKKGKTFPNGKLWSSLLGHQKIVRGHHSLVQFWAVGNLTDHDKAYQSHWYLVKWQELNLC